MILNLLLNTQVIWIIFIKILKNTIQTRNVKYKSVFDYVIVDMLSNKTFNLVVTELFIRRRKLNSYLFFITQLYFAVPKNIELNSMHSFIMKIPNKQELQQI